MTVQLSTAAKRASLMARLFPQGVPRLWCPPLTHYDSAGGLDRNRIVAHLRHLSRHVKGFLIPGSTGDGWELHPEEIGQLLAIALEEVRSFGGHVLIGILRTNADETLRTLRQAAEALGATAPYLPSPACGFTVCAPRGRELSQERIGGAVSSIHETG